MATQQNLTLHQGNDETIVVTVEPAAGGSLADVTALEFVMKPSACESDDDDNALLLSTTTTGVTITSQSASEIVAEVEIPAAALAEPYARVWRLDALSGTARRTALYGSVTVIDL